jgi:hypothetical protein
MNNSWDEERRNYRGGQNRPIWIVDLKTHDLVSPPWTDSKDVYPVWVDDSVFFISDRDGVANVWEYQTKTKKLAQITKFTDFDVKAMDSGAGTVVFEQAGYVHELDPKSGKTHIINIVATGDFPWMMPQWKDVSNRMTNLALSATGKRAAVEARGEIRGSSKQVTWTCVGAACPWGPSTTGQAIVWPDAVRPISTRLGYTTPRVAAIVAVCESIKRGLVANGVPAGKIEVIYSGTDLARFHPDVDGRRIRAELGLAPGHALVTQVGIRSWRGNDDVLEAMARVCHAAPHARLLFVGAPAPRIATLRDRAFRRGIGEAVAVLGHREDIPEILAASDLVVDASYAGLGLTGSLREALAVETPVIGTDIEGHPELILEGETGLLVPPRNPDALAQAILRMLENPTRAKAMARAGRKRVEAHFSMAQKVQRTEALYRRLLDARGRR